MPTDTELRERIVDSFRGEHFNVPYARIQQRAGRRTRRWAVAGAAVATGLAATVVAAVALGGPQRDRMPSADTGLADLDRSCQSEWTRTTLDPFWTDKLLPADRTAMPPLRFDFRDGERAMRIYANPRVMFTCERTAAGTVGSPTVAGDVAGEPMFVPNGTDLQYFGAFSEGSGGHYVGAAPPGTSRVEAVLADGEILPGRVDGDLFAVWTADKTLSSAILRLYVGDQVVAEGQPTRLEGDFDATAFEAACEAQVRKALGVAESMPPLRFRLREGEYALWLYGDDHVMVPCRRQQDGYVSAGMSYRPAEDAGWEPFQRTMASGDGRGWVFGRAPDGALRADVLLLDGRRVPAQLAEGFFAAWWPSAGSNDLPVEIRAETATETLVHRGNKVTRTPR